MHLIPVVCTWFCIMSLLYYQTKKVKQDLYSRMFLEAMFLRQKKKKKPWKSFSCITIGNWLDVHGAIKHMQQSGVIYMCMKNISSVLLREKKVEGALSWWSSGQDSRPPLQEALVQSLIRELRSCKPQWCSQKKYCYRIKPSYKQ